MITAVCMLSSFFANASISKCNSISLQIAKWFHHHTDTGERLEKHQLPPDCGGTSDIAHQHFLTGIERGGDSSVRLGRSSYSLVTHGDQHRRWGLGRGWEPWLWRASLAPAEPQRGIGPASWDGEPGGWRRRVVLGSGFHRSERSTGSRSTKFPCSLQYGWRSDRRNYATNGEEIPVTSAILWLPFTKATYNSVEQWLIRHYISVPSETKTISMLLQLLVFI